MSLHGEGPEWARRRRERRIKFAAVSVCVLLSVGFWVAFAAVAARAVPG